jgi:hypothetical protein
MIHHKIQREDTCHAFNWTSPGSRTHPLFVLSPTQIVATRLAFYHTFARVPNHPLFVLSLTQIFVICMEIVELETRVSFKDFVMQMVAIIEKII